MLQSMHIEAFQYKSPVWHQHITTTHLKRQTPMYEYCSTSSQRVPWTTGTVRFGFDDLLLCQHSHLNVKSALTENRLVSNHGQSVQSNSLLYVEEQRIYIIAGMTGVHSTPTFSRQGIHKPQAHCLIPIWLVLKKQYIPLNSLGNENVA